jgi:hypothetical protein
MCTFNRSVAVAVPSLASLKHSTRILVTEHYNAVPDYTGRAHTKLYNFRKKHLSQTLHGSLSV